MGSWRSLKGFMVCFYGFNCDDFWSFEAWRLVRPEKEKEMVGLNMNGFL